MLLEIRDSADPAHKAPVSCELALRARSPGSRSRSPPCKPATAAGVVVVAADVVVVVVVGGGGVVVVVVVAAVVTVFYCC